MKKFLIFTTSVAVIGVYVLFFSSFSRFSLVFNVRDGLASNFSYKQEANSLQSNNLKQTESYSYEDKLKSFDIILHPGNDYSVNGNADKKSLEHCEFLVYKTLLKLPQNSAHYLKHLTLHFSPKGRRGLGGGNTVVLKCSNMSDKEIVSVFVHEMGHVTDTGVLNGHISAGESEFHDGNNPVYLDDPSVEFYRISFLDENTLKPSANKLDFVSGYAMSDPFEDFAESYNFYVLHGDMFREMAKTSASLRKKYNFLKRLAFNGKEYYNLGGLKISGGDKYFRYYDATLIDYDFVKFLN